MPTGVIVATQACDEPLWQSSTEQQESCFALTSAAVLWRYISAHLCAEQISIDIFAVAQAYCEPVLQSSTEQGSYFALTSALVLQHCTPVWRANLHRCDCSGTRLLSA